jgi:3-deoxy-7-phosphoheptulonate synthase/3,4-dideoxy-4-amino-D-arabino-heptulosonate 7-phosphate synthase
MGSWQCLPQRQSIAWTNVEALAQTRSALAELDGLVTYQDCLKLQTSLGEVASGRALVVQGGDCVETYSSNSPSYVRANLELLAELGDSLSRVHPLPCVLIGRFAGQFAKPRTRLTDETGFPIWRGDLVNSREEEFEARTPDPHNLLLGYDNSRNALAWARDSGTEVFSSHEAILLDYEEGLLRSSATAEQRVYASSAHFLWVGYRTADPNEAHVAFAASVANPIGVKVGADTTAATFARLCRVLNPDRQPGRLSAIIRLGRSNLERQLPQFIKVAQSDGTPIVWMCDPMHANNARSAAGAAIRYLKTMREEVRTYVDVHAAMGTWPGGLHLEMTSDHVSECQEDATGRQEESSRPLIDARLNADQAMDLGFEFASALRATFVGFEP